MNKKMRIYYSSGVKYHDIYYLSALHMNALFMYDEKKDKLTFLTSFHKEKKSEHLYLKTFLWKNEAWFIPNQADYIAIVNLDTYSVSYMHLDYKNCYNNQEIKYINILHYNEKYLCLIPWAVDAVMIIDLQKRDAVAYYDIVDLKKNYQSAIFLNNKIYFFPWKAKEILVLDLETNGRVELPQLDEEGSFGDVVYDKKSECLFHTPAKKDYILVNNLNKKLTKKIKFDGWGDKTYKTFYSSDTTDNIFFWGHEKNIVIKLNKNDKSMKVYSISPQYSKKYFYPIYSDGVEALVYGGNCIIKYNADKDEFSYLYINITFDTLIQAIKAQNPNFNKIENVEILYENDVRGLMYFLFFTSNIATKNIYEIKENVGNQIYNIV